jgi:cytochrome c
MSRFGKRVGAALMGMALWLGAVAAVWGGWRRASGLPGKPRSRVAIRLIGLAAVAVLVASAVYAFLTFGRDAVALPGQQGDPAPALMIRYGCAGCHVIPGVPGARGQVGPSLAGFAGRLYVGGAATNDPGNLVRWLVNPRALDPNTAMPVSGINEAEARVVAAYLLRQR